MVVSDGCESLDLTLHLALPDAVASVRCAQSAVRALIRGDSRYSFNAD